MKIMIKNQPHLLMLSISLSLGAIAILNAAQQEKAPSNNSAIKQDQHVIIAVGKDSYGQNAVTGKACIVMKRKELKKICKGDIVVAPAIHSTWYAELSLAGAIITEKQDDSNHARGYGKKLDIPIIVGVEDATKKIVDGQTIICDPVTHTIYHVAYPEHRLELIFDKLPLEAQGSSGQTFYHIPVSHNKIISSKNMYDGGIDYYIPNQLGEGISEIQAEKVHKVFSKKRITKDIYSAYFNRFKKFILGEKSQFERTKRWFGIKAVETGAKTFGGCDDFAVECISVGESFFDSDEEHFVKILYDIGQSEEYIEYIDSLLNECSKKPGDLNWVARVSHKRHIESIETPEDIQKEDLMKHPKEYRKIEGKVDHVKREALIGAGLFVRFWIKERLPL